LGEKVHVLGRNSLQLVSAVHRTDGAAHSKCVAHWEFLPSVILIGRGTLEECGTLGSWRGTYSPKPEIVSNFTNLLITYLDLPGRITIMIFHPVL